jgi:hypothetical protein
VTGPDIGRSDRVARARRTRAGGRPRETRAVDPGTWTADEIAAAIEDWTRLVGRAPRAYEWSSTGRDPGTLRWLAEYPRWPSAATVVYHHGSWIAGLQAAGLPARALEHDLPRRERVASALALRAAGCSVRSIADQLGVDLRTAYRYLASTTCRDCGGPALYGERCLECAPRNGPAATGEEITVALRAWAREHGTPPRSQDWTAGSPKWRDAWPRWPGTATVLRVYGSWNHALEAAGLPTHRHAWSRAETLERLAAWAREHARAPTLADARDDSRLPGQAACTRLFGSWNEALRAAGIAPEHHAHWDDRDIHAILREWASWHAANHGGEASAASYARWAGQHPERVPSASSIRRRYDGSWNAARTAAGLKPSRGGRPRERPR